jgi:hypothetical protein
MAAANVDGGANVDGDKDGNGVVANSAWKLDDAVGVGVGIGVAVG